MKANTRAFGEIDIDDSKIITIEKGMIGFPEYVHFALIYNSEREESPYSIKWLQCMDDGDISFPVINPAAIDPGYTLSVNDELLSPLGELKDEDAFLLVTVSVPSDIKKLTANLKAPIVINMNNNKGIQVIVENDYKVKCPIYDLLIANKEKREKAGE